MNYHPQDPLSLPSLPQQEQHRQQTRTPPTTTNNTLSNDLRHAYGVFLRSFALAFGVRYGISSILRLLKILRKGDIASLFSLKKVFFERYIIMDAVRLGMAAGGFGGSYNLLSSLGQLLRGKKDGYNYFFAGLLSGFALLFLESSSRRTISLYVLGRVSEGLYNYLKNHGMWHFWGSHWNHGDTLLFSLASAQIMYAYVMRPETLDKSYYKFIVRTGPIAEVILRAVCAANRGKPIDVDEVTNYVASVSHLHPLPPLPLSPNPPSVVPCSILHPQQPYCTLHAMQVLISSFKKILPLYATLTFVPLLLTKFSRYIRDPLSNTLNALYSTLRSTTFLSTFVALYMSVVCIQRRMVIKDHKFIYWLAGAIGSLSILIEKKSRRAELALYALPRGLDSLYMLLLDRKWMASVPHGELLLFCFSMAGIMYFYENEPHSMSPFFVGGMDRLVGGSKLSLIRQQKQKKQ